MILPAACVKSIGLLTRVALSRLASCAVFSDAAGGNMRVLCVATLNGTRPNTQNTRTGTQIYEEEGPSEASSIVFRVEQQGGDIKRKNLPLHLIQTKGEYCRNLNSFPLPSGSFCVLRALLFGRHSTLTHAGFSFLPY